MQNIHKLRTCRDNYYLCQGLHSIVTQKIEVFEKERLTHLTEWGEGGGLETVTKLQLHKF
jgi:hypothetical protein